MANKVPKIRFKGFTDDWEQREFGEILNVYSFKQYIKEPESNGKYKIIQQGNEPIIGYANGNPFEEYENIVLFGDHTVSLYKPQEPFFVATDGVKILGTTKNLDGNFFNATLEKYKPESEGYKRHFSILKKQRICFTENSDEQKRVGNFFENLDRLITLHQRKCDQTKELKKFMLQKMFPKKGEKNPEIRFSGFTDDWEQREFGEILNVYSFKQYIKEPESNGKYKIIQQGNEPIIGYANGNPFEEYENIVLFGDHTVSLYKPQEPFFVATDGVKILGTTKNLDGNFFNATLEKYKPESEGYKRHFSILKKQRICFTENSDEQKRVGNFFENLDRLITLHQRKCEQLKELKKFMLQNMFPKKG